MSHSPVVPFRAPAADVENWRQQAAKEGRTLSGWIRRKLLGPDYKVGYVSVGRAYALSFNITDANRFQCVLAFPVQSPDLYCCEEGHQRPEDAIDHGIAKLREAMRAEPARWPEGSSGQIAYLAPLGGE